MESLCINPFNIIQQLLLIISTRDGCLTVWVKLFVALSTVLAQASIASGTWGWSLEKQWLNKNDGQLIMVCAQCFLSSTNVQLMFNYSKVYSKVYQRYTWKVLNIPKNSGDLGILGMHLRPGRITTDPGCSWEQSGYLSSSVTNNRTARARPAFVGCLRDTNHMKHIGYQSSDRQNRQELISHD